MSKVLLFILVVALLAWGIPVLLGKAMVTPNSLEPTDIAGWTASLIQYWLNLVEELIRLLKP